MVAAAVQEQMHCQVAMPLERGYNPKQLDHLASPPTCFTQSDRRHLQGVLRARLIVGPEVAGDRRAGTWKGHAAGRYGARDNQWPKPFSDR
jgi:hypothetical protein